jgi:lipopolysaccharide export system protein LptA
VLGANTAGTSITASYDSNNERLILTGSDTLADYQSVLDSVTFSSGNNPNNSNANPTRTVSWVLNDGGSSFSLSAAQNTTITIAHEPPNLISVAPSLGFTQGNTTTISPSITVTDFDSANLVGGTVQIAGSFAGDGDVLGFSTSGTSVTASYNAASETLTLSGTDTLAHYQSVLDSVKFSSGSDPTNHGSNSTRAVTWVVNDGNGSLGSSAVQTTTISITPLDAAPTLSSVATSANFTENGSAVTLAGSASISDPDSTIMTSATVSIAGGVFVNDGDVLAFGTAGSIIASYDSSTETLTLTGSDTLAHYKSVLDSVTFIANGDNPKDYWCDPARTVPGVGEDDFNIGNTPATTTVSITAINDAPTLTSVAASVSFLEGTTLALSPSATASDPDSLDLANATVKITGGSFAGDGDQLAANVAGTHITASYNAATETLTLTGSDPLATYQAVLDSITFASGDNPTDYGSNPTRTVTWVLNDGSASTSPNAPQ